MTTETHTSGNTVGRVVGTPIATGGANEFGFNLNISSTTITGVTVGQQVWVAATTDFPNLLTYGATLAGSLDNSHGWWVLKRTGMTTETHTSGNTVGRVVGTPIATGGANEFGFNLNISSTTITGVTVGQQVWVAATTTDFPNLRTYGATLTGNLDRSLGWWVLSSTTS